MHVVRWSGQSGRSYDFQLYSVGDALPLIPGVYVFTKPRDDDLWGAIYFGETGDLSDRFDNHHAMPCITTNGATHLGIHTEGMLIEQARTAAERDLLAKHQTPCNQR